jgi:hypothetical protein
MDQMISFQLLSAIAPRSVERIEPATRPSQESAIVRPKVAADTSSEKNAHLSLKVQTGAAKNPMARASSMNPPNA